MKSNELQDSSKHKQTAKAQEQIDRQTLVAAQEAIFSEDPARMQFGFTQLLDLREEKLFVKSIENLLKSKKKGDIDLSELDLSGKKLSGFYLANANLQGAMLQGTKLQSANLQNANIKDANLKDADLEKTDLTNAA